MTSALAGDGWRNLPDREKEYFRDRLREECARRGIPLATKTTPGGLAQLHEPHLNVTRDYLDLIDYEMVRLRDTPNGATMVITTSQVGKSLKCSRWSPFWWLTEIPRHRIILGSFASHLAAGHAAACRDYVNAYGHNYGLRLRDDEATRTDWTLTTGGGLRARGVRSGLVGNPMDLGIIDDPYADRAAADSPTIREAVWNWYSSAFVSRRSPDCRELIVMHRWHIDDLIGRLLKREGRIEEGGRWRVIHLPAIALAPDPDRGIYPDALGREPGQPLQHPKIPEGDTAALLAHWNRMRDSMTARDWASLGLGVPISAEGALLTEQQIEDATREPGKPARVGVGVDPSGGGRDNAGIMGGHLDTTGKFWWTHNRTARMSSNKWPREACLLAHEISADIIVFEANFGGDMANSLIRQAWVALQAEGAIPKTALCPYIKSVHSRRSKVLRAEPIAQAIVTGRAGFGTDPSLRGFCFDWTRWEPGSTWSPGALDAGVHLAAELLPPVGSAARTHSVAKVRRDSVNATGGVAARRR